jgi:hypothetical protein
MPSIATGDGRYVTKASRSITATTASGNITLTSGSTAFQKIDANGFNRDVTLPTPTLGAQFWIVNASAGATDLVVKNAAGSTIGTVSQNEEGIFVGNGSAWTLLRIATIALS